MSTQSFELKGNLFTLSVLQLLNADLSIVKAQLSEKISQAPKFFKGAPIVINLAEVQDEPLVLSDLKSILSELSLNPVGICNGNDEHNETAKSLGMSVLNYTKDVAPSVSSNTKTEVVEKHVYVPAQVVNGTVRSGQQIYAKDRDLIIMGAVSHGAEVIADGNIHIYGTLRGRAIAGAQGNDSASIYCQKLEAELVSVNGSYWISDSLQGEFWGNPCKITQTNESLELTALVKG
ncbi:septum site-determining protein MinC [Pseudoalteromonas luteoviolacea]|uniref:Probable septum site-determining protein MinC n=1 Tax=Pseudoalteromonas luteoviolacea H33 TaxID=1365251 RepID=A0A167DJ79_9GAMM|nr:septum site-determining protein MinC [Pseudoalteromonas luteoviolacea]KZN48901.1 septum site-determining protein MinC [Pseudoalteromonas luteoviolacea H33]KZN74596.1 septum site-determining protein MinC [Pseudoalteromonas luteoviolacea H33-S]MBQ4877839.1 septum site-determining protein MinC [Pseudoalteromonas luteoviolacea]MBQ4906874.1 septum site-determining protein MinC [Pseudoalteromonas luteoviolacea]MCF6442769.1 septum site-determining protein MinC [Pseudoalteromonas luteoviolacea]